MNLFRHGDTYVFALTYGADVQWVRNVLAAGEADALIRRHTVHLVEPEVFVDPWRRMVPFPVRQFLAFARVTEFLRMRVAKP
jgi:hypothetical protein